MASWCFICYRKYTGYKGHRKCLEKYNVEKQEEQRMKAKFSHVMNDDSTGITFLYFDCGYVQDLEGPYDRIYTDQFCIHMDSKDTDKLKAALTNEPNENTVFSPQEMEIIRNLLTIHKDNVVYASEGDYAPKPATMTDSEWENFLEKLQ